MVENTQRILFITNTSYFYILCFCASYICAVHSSTALLQEKQEITLLDKNYFSNSSNLFNAQKCHNLFWLHAPKTSSTLCTSLENLCCPENFDRVVSNLIESDYFPEIGWGCAKPKGLSCILNGQHQHYPVSDYEIKKYQHEIGVIGVTMIRDPKLRLISAFLDSMHREGLPREENEKLLNAISNHPVNKTNTEEQNLYLTAADYMGHNNMIGCYTKMLNGYDCYSSFLTRDSPFNKTAIDLAISRLRSFYFVGIFEEYEESIQVFHAMAKVKNVHWTELRKSRLSPASFNITQHLTDNIPFRDPYDDIIYNEAKELFKVSKASSNILLKS